MTHAMDLTAADPTGIVTGDDIVETTEHEMASAPAQETYRTFTDQPVAFLGEPTSDRRILPANMELQFRDTPMPLQWCRQNSGGHSDSYTVGVIEDMHRRDNTIMASGYMLNTPEADEAANSVHHGVSNPSIDLVGTEWHYADDEGKELASFDELMDYVDRNRKLPMTAISKGTIAATTLVHLPAFGKTRMALNDGREPRDFALVASASPFTPSVYDHTFFEDPKLKAPTVLTMNDQGRIYGHLALFGECHRSVQSSCVRVPRSPSNYDQFHTSPPLHLDNGKRLPVGRLTVGTGHAHTSLRPAPAVAHYDNTGSCFAFVRAGEDRHGIWFSGVAAPGASAELVQQGLSAPLSGDWRNFGKGLDLVAMLGVNTPGFAVRGRDDDDGVPASLVASLAPTSTEESGGVFTLEDIKSAIVEGFREVMSTLAPATVPVAPDLSVTVEPEQTAPDRSANEQIAALLAERG
jgi:hypothetical protein